MKALFDTNIIVDVLANRTDFYEFSFKSLAICDGNICQSCITSNTVTDIAYILHRYGKNQEEVKSLLTKLFFIVEILDVNATDCTNAIHSAVLDFEDAVLAECAERHFVDFIITRNPKDYKKSSIPCISPYDFVQKFSN